MEINRVWGRRACWVCLVVCATGLVPSSASAYVLLSGSSGATLPVSVEAPTAVFHWDGNAPEITDRDQIQADGAWETLSDKEVMSLLLELAVNVWNDVPGSYVRMSIEESSASALSTSDKQNSIVTEATSNLSEAGHALPIISDKIIKDCDIVISNNSVSAISLAHTLVHELGHCLGLGHEHKNEHAIMGYTADRKNHSLGADDMAGLIYLYPNPDSSPSGSGCGLIAGSSDTSQAGLMFWFLLPMGVAGLRRSRRE